ncbi:MAG: efflux RND transporter periplasmic adaptor subunit [bacterium]
MRKLIVVAALLLGTACSSDKKNNIPVTTAAVARRDIVIDAQATGVVEPINVVEVKSKASGLIVKMPVETGYQVKPGDLLVQIETRDVQNQFDQSDAALKAAKSKLDVSTAQKKRADDLFKQRIITATEYETAQLDFANAQSQLVSATSSMDLSKQRLEDATVRAPVEGTIIEKTVSLGTVITSATGAFGGGTTLLKMANLGQVRIRALFNETDIGQVKPGQVATVTVDAYPERRFVGTVEKIEPQAVVQQNVTMFPVLVTLENGEGLLKPGMNGETSVLVDQRSGVLAVPNDAVRNVREAVATAPILGLDPDSVRAQMAVLQAAGRNGGGGRQGGGGGGAGGAGATPPAGAPPAGAAPAGARGAAKGEVALDPQRGQGGQGGGQMPDVTDKDCKAITAALKKKPAESAKLDALRQQMMSGSGDRSALRDDMQKIYAAIGVDPRIAGACRRKEMQAGGGAPGGQAAAGGQGAAGGQMAQSGQRGGRGGRGGGQGGAAGAGGAGLTIGGGETRGGGGRRSRSGLVFVKKGTTFEPRIIQMGASNFDYTEVLSGVKEGEQVAMLAAAALQFARQQQNDRNRANSGVPGLQQAPAAGAGGAGGGGRAGGGGGGGGGGRGGA